MPYRALHLVLRGAQAPVPPGELIPETFLDVDGVEHSVDFDRLVDLGAAEQVSAAEAKKTSKD